MAFNSSSKDASAVPTTATSTSNATVATAPTPTPASTSVAAASTTSARSQLVSPQQQAPLQPRPPSTLQFLQHHNRQQFHPQFTSQHGIFAASAASQRPQLTTKPPAAPIQEAIRYPVASSGRGYISRSVRPGQLPNKTAKIAANPGGGGTYPPSRPTMLGFPPPPPLHPPTVAQHVRGVGYGPFRPPNLHPSHMVSPSYPSTVVKGIPLPVLPHSKVAATQGSVPGCNGQKEQSDKGKDDTFVIVRDRKVRISDGASLYALCRSWLRNGHSEESQSRFGDIVRSLPKPLPAPSSDTHLPKSKDNYEEEEEDDGSAENLSPEDLLKKHINRAKRVRARLREERLQRIARYRSRLALLLPPLVEQCRNDESAGT
ncbi:hypothetical protein Ancab_035053 [Ancistrocladus abbreviatus]